MSSRLKFLGPLVVWTVFVWASRIRNIWNDDELSTSGQLLRTVFAVIFLTFAAALVQRLVARRGEPLRRGDRALLLAFVLWTVGFWLVRGIGIIVDDHSFGFTVVHTVLMVVSIAIAGLAASVLRGSSISSSRLAAQ